MFVKLIISKHLKLFSGISMKISEKELRNKARFFRALGDVTRLKILFLLLEGEKCQCGIISKVGLSQPTVSRHLQILVDNGLLTFRREGNKRIYSLTKTARSIVQS